MNVRNCSEIGENLQKIVKRLIADDTLVNLLYYTDKDPLSQPPLTEDEKREQIFGKLVRPLPRVSPKDNSKSLIAIRVISGTQNMENNEFKDVSISLEVFVPLTQWIIKNDNLRPFLILGEIQKSLNNMTVNGLGKMVGGNFELNFLTEEIGSYQMFFNIVAYD